MKKLHWLGSCFGVCLLALPLSAQEKDYTKPILDKARKAMGSGPQHARQGLTCDCTASVAAGPNVNIDISGSWSIQGIDQFRTELTATLPDGNAKSVTVVIKGNKGWAHDQDRNNTEEAPDGILPTIRADLRAMRLAYQPELLRNKALKLSPLGEMKINGETTTGIHVKQKGLPDISMYFSKKTGLPVKATVQGKDSPNGPDRTHAFTFSDYKKGKLGNRFTRIVIHSDERRIAEVRFSNVQLHQSLQKNLFAKPK